MINFPRNVNMPEAIGDNLRFLFDIVPKFYDSGGSPITTMRSYVGVASLSSGQAEVSIPDGGFSKWYTVSITPDTSSVDYRYGVNFHNNNKFVIHSSDGSDVTQVRWMAIGY